MEDSLHRLIKGLNAKEQKAILQRIGKRGSSSHQARIFRTMNKENSWSKSRNRKLAETLEVSTRQLAVEKNSLYRRILHYLRREDTTAYAIKGIYEELHHFFMLRDRGLIPLGLKSLRRAKKLAQQSDHQELLAFILYQEMFILRKHRTNEITGSLDEVAAEYKTLTENLEENFLLVRGFNTYFSEANKYNPNVKDPAFLEFVQRFAQPFENNPRAEYDRLVFFNRLWINYAELVPFDIVTSAKFYESTPFSSNEMQFNLYIDHLGMIDKFIKLQFVEKALKMLQDFELKNNLSPFPPEVYKRFASARFFYYLNNKRKEDIAEKITTWEKELRDRVQIIDLNLVQYSNIITYYFMCNQWEKVVRWADDFLYYSNKAYGMYKITILKVLFHKLIALIEMAEIEKEKSHSRLIQSTLMRLDIGVGEPEWLLFKLLTGISVLDKSGTKSICKEIVGLIENKELGTTSRISAFTEILVWSYAKINNRTTYEELYLMRQ